MTMRAFFATGLLLLLSACSTPSSHMGMDHEGMMQGSPDASDGPSSADLENLPEAKPASVLEVKDGDTITLNPELVRKTLGARSFAMYAYNGRFPGPTITVQQGATFTVNVKNEIDQPTTVHWHGLRLDNRFDGAAGVTQDPIEPGGSFTYTVTVPDEGLFWYHPHVREDMQQDMGLYGLIRVLPRDAQAYTPVDREEYIVLDDLLLNGGVPVGYGRNEADHALMGRFGNTLLINGSPPKAMDVGLGDVVRFFVLNASNTRTYRIVAPEGGTMKIVGADAGRVGREYAALSAIIAPSERVIVEMTFGNDAMEDGAPATITTPIVTAGSPDKPVTVLAANITGGVHQRDESSAAAQVHDDVVADIDAYRPYFDKPIDETLHLSVTQSMMGGMDHGGMMHHDTGSDGIEWEDSMAMMNAMATKGNTQWKLIDEATKKENMDIHYSFKKSDKVKIRIVNDTEEQGSDHAMQHPIHFHGQRFLVLAVDGKPNEHLVWKDTVLVPTGKTVDILLDASNPGEWMMHCHIAEHLSNGMMGTFSVSKL